MHLINQITHKFWIFATMFFVTNAFAGTPFSQYGMIQNVQNYANNPFYNPNTAQITTPRIVYANGPALSHDDCTRAVQNIIETVCSTHDFCQTTTLADVRPSIMIKLSTLPGNNYASSCSGYIDTIYENYKKRMGYSTHMPTTTSFPTTTTVASVETPKKSTYQSRAQELKSLQAANAIDTTVRDTDFPTTINDLSMSERTALQEESYQNYMESKAYVPLTIIQDEKSNTSGKKALTECEQIYKCIADLGAQEYKAEEEFFEIYNTITTISSTADNDWNVLEEKADQLGSAMITAELSPCTCTENIKETKTKQNYRKIMGVTCDEKFINDAKKSISDYMKNNMWK